MKQKNRTILILFRNYHKYPPGGSGYPSVSVASKSSENSNSSSLKNILKKGTMQQIDLLSPSSN